MTFGAEYGADPDMHIGLLTEHELTRVLQMLAVIQVELGIEGHEDSELGDLEMETQARRCAGRNRALKSG